MTIAFPRPHSQEPLTPWPILKSHSITLSNVEQKRAMDVATHLQNEDASLIFPWSREGVVSIGWQLGPTLYLEDHRGVDLVPEKSAKAFEYRMLGLAGDEDAYLLSGDSDRLFEKQIQHMAGLGAPTILNLAMGENNQGRSLAVACIDSTVALETLVNMARKAGVLNIAPYQVTDDVWALAYKIGTLSQCPVKIMGPNPRLSEMANDKLWFTRLVRMLLGDDAVPKTYEAYSLISATIYMMDLAKRNRQLVMKIPTSAGGLGNITVLSKDIINRPLKQVYNFISEKLRAKGWITGKSLLVGVWDDHVISTPSIQLWIPKIDDGAPIIEGIFEQVIEGSVGAFVGAKRASLESATERLMTLEGTQIAQVMQYLGYYGRLSLDTVLLKTPNRKMTVHWIEANARWGGVSIPMTIGNKIVDNNAPVSVLVLQKFRGKGEETSLRQKLSKIGIPEIALRKNIKKGFVQLLPSSERLQLIAAYELDEKEMELIGGI